MGFDKLIACLDLALPLLMNLPCSPCPSVLGILPVGGEDF